MIANLSNLSAAAQPTPFHRLLRALDDRGKLLRVYTQNIDALELKAGLTFGVPDFTPATYGRGKGKGKEKEGKKRSGKEEKWEVGEEEEGRKERQDNG